MTSSTVRLPSSAPRRRRLLVGGVGLAVLGAAGVLLVGGGPETTVVTFAGVREVVVDVDRGPVAVRGGPGAAVVLRTTRQGSLLGSPATGHGVENGVLTVRAGCSGAGIRCTVAEELTVPAGVPVRVRTEVGAIEAVDLDVPRFSAETAAGSVEASFARPPAEVGITTGAGTVVVRVPDVGYRVEAGSAAGATRVEVRADPSAARRLSVHTAAGAVSVLPR
jgi:hypothetical protein